MDKNIIKKLIIVFVIIIIILIIGILVLGKNNKTSVDQNGILESTNKTKITNVNTHKEYYTIANIIATYYGYVAENNEAAISKIISKDYLKNNSIEKINSQFPVFNANKMSVQTNNNISIYYVWGNLKEYLDSIESKDVYFQVFINNNNNAFEILPLNKEEYTKILNENKLVEAKEIAKNEYNGFSYLEITDMTKASFIFNNYSQILKSNIGKSYNLLDEEYRDNKFNSIEEYKKYLSNKEGLDFSILSEYSVEEKEGYTEYNCVDQNGNRFIFKEQAVMEYTVMLDDYVVNTSEFLEKYNSTTNQGKVILNIDKFFKAINDKSYYYAYNCLSDGFKNNYFKTLEDFEAYVNQNLYNNCYIQFEEYEEEGTLCKYTINIIDLEQEESVTQKTIIMQLNEGTDFEMSFNV